MGFQQGGARKMFGPDFAQRVEPYFALLIGLAKKNEVLRRTRDLLLPRLISGDLDVSNLDIRISDV